MQYVQDRNKEGLDDYFPHKRRKKKNCKLKHIKNWLKLFVIDHHNKKIGLE